MPDSVSVGDTFGLVTVIGSPVKGASATFFPVVCGACGDPSFRPLRLLNENSGSCGCLRGNVKHRGKRERLYSIWSNMRDRCFNPSSKAFSNYGARGITVSPLWDSYSDFRDWAMTHGYSDDLTLDRIDNDGDYAPDNCRWATVAQQSTNRRNNRMLSLGDERKSLKEWSQDARCVVSYGTLYQRVVKLGWGLEGALATRPQGA